MFGLLTAYQKPGNERICHPKQAEIPPILNLRLATPDTDFIIMPLSCLKRVMLEAVMGRSCYGNKAYGGNCSVEKKKAALNVLLRRLHCGLCLVRGKVLLLNFPFSLEHFAFEVWADFINQI